MYIDVYGITLKRKEHFYVLGLTHTVCFSTCDLPSESVRAHRLCVLIHCAFFQDRFVLFPCAFFEGVAFLPTYLIQSEW